MVDRTLKSNYYYYYLYLGSVSRNEVNGIGSDVPKGGRDTDL